jgi:hypothetical protein
MPKKAKANQDALENLTRKFATTKVNGENKKKRGS